MKVNNDISDEDNRILCDVVIAIPFIVSLLLVKIAVIAVKVKKNRMIFDEFLRILSEIFEKE